MNVRVVDLPLPVMLALHDGDVATAERLIGLPIPAEFAGQHPGGAASSASSRPRPEPPMGH